MKALIVVLAAFIYSSPVWSEDCSEAYSSADDAYTYARRGYNASDLEEVHENARRAMSAADDAMSSSEDCECDDAYSAADDAHTYAKRAFNAEEFDVAVDYMRKAKSAADDAMSYAEDCGT